MNEFVMYDNKDRGRLMELIANIDLSHPVRISWKPFKKERSLSANALLHKWFREIAYAFVGRGMTAISHTTDDGVVHTVAVDEDFIKDMLKLTYLGTEWTYRRNAQTHEWERLQELRHTKFLDRGEMSHFMDQVYHWSLAKGILLTIPENSEYQQWKKEEVA